MVKKNKKIIIWCATSGTPCIHVLNIKKQSSLHWLINFSKLLVLLKSNLKLQTQLKFLQETAKQTIINSRAGFSIKIYHSASRNSVEKSVSAQKSAKIIFKSAKST